MFLPVKVVFLLPSSWQRLSLLRPFFSPLKSAARIALNGGIALLLSLSSVEDDCRSAGVQSQLAA